MSAAAPDGGDWMVRTLSADGGVWVRTVHGTGLVREGCERHATSATASSALGRALLGALLLASTQADEETVQVQFRGDGPLGTLTTIADGAGRVRGFAAHPQADLPLDEGRLDVGGLVGTGVLAVVRNATGWREPYSGIVPIQSGEIANDLAHYLAESEQKPSALALGVLHESDGSVRAAGGYLVQALPDAEDETVRRVDDMVRGLPPVTQLLREGLGAPDLAELLLAGVGHRDLHASTPRFHCPCTRERVARAVTLLGRDELRALQRDGTPLETFCRFCSERYELSPDEIGALVPDA